MAESTISPAPHAGLALVRRALFFALLGPMAAAAAGRIRATGQPSLASFTGTALMGASARDYALLGLTAAALVFLAVLALVPTKKVK